ncbi:MAG: hypothetical protein MUP67_10310 [Acidimicrobiia bacterium]|nr:hypothetical protein [Acidimicrobiia bacterium]
MPPMPVYYVGKGTQFGVLDQFDGTDPSVYEAARERLSGSATLEELAGQRAAEGGLSEADVQHFKEHWLKSWWKGKHVDQVLRAGIVKALDTAMANEEHGLLPIEALWVCAQEDVFQVYVNQGPHQVTVIVYTPPPEEYPSDPRTLDEKIWVVKARDDLDGDIPGPITRLNPAGEWPVLIERQLKHVAGAS